MSACEEENNAAHTGTGQTTLCLWFWLALFIMAVTLWFGWYSCPHHPLFNEDLPWIGAGYDFFHYYVTNNALALHVQNIYGSEEVRSLSRALANIIQTDWEVYDNHPLPFYLLMLPFTDGKEFAQGFMLHKWFEFSFFCAGMVALSGLTVPRPGLRWLCALLLCAFAVFPGIASDNIVLGQVGMSLAASLGLAFAGSALGLPWLAGLFFALAILLKMYPALLLCFFWLKGDRKTLLWTCICLLALGLSAGLQWGFQHYGNYLTFLNHGIEYNSAVSNQSLPALLANTGLHYSPVTLKAVNIILVFLGFNVIWRFFKRYPCSGFTLGLLKFSTWIALLHIISPLSWGHHHMTFCLPLLGCLALLTMPAPARNGSKSQRWAFLTLLLICILSCCEGETVTRECIKRAHYVMCVYRLPLMLNLGILMSLCQTVRAAVREEATAQAPQTEAKGNAPEPAEGVKA